MASKPLDAPDDLADRCTASRNRLGRSRFWLLSAVLLLVWFAAWPITDAASKLTLAALELTYLFGCWKTRRAMLWVTPALYLPYVWQLVKWTGSAENGNGWDWILALFHLPSRFIVAYFEPLPQPNLTLLSAATAVGIFLVLVTAGRSSRHAAVFMAVVALVLSALNN